MVTVTQLTSNLKAYINTQLNNMSQTTPIIGLLKPVITRVLDKNMSKVTKAMGLVADKDGNIDIEGILTEMADNIMKANPFVVNTEFIGDIEIGGGLIKLNIPFTDKKLVFNTVDLAHFKEMLITNI